MDYNKKAELIADYYDAVKDNSDFVEFIQYNDLGIPLAIVLSTQLANGLTDEGKEVLEETWLNVCKHQLVDPDGEYDSIDDLLPMWVDPQVDEE